MRNDKRLFDVDPVLGTKTFFTFDDAKDQFTLETQQDVTEIVDQNKKDYATADKKFKGDMHRIASIPMNVYMELRANGTMQDPKRLKAWLNDPDNRYFRTKPGRV